MHIARSLVKLRFGKAIGNAVGGCGPALLTILIYQTGGDRQVGFLHLWIVEKAVLECPSKWHFALRIGRGA